jgi:RNA polymerase sigma-70 factor (ECF subfamily)
VSAKTKLRDAGIPFTLPRPDQLLERLDAVLAVVYLVFNEGYAATGGEARVRDALCDEAIRLARLLATLLPEQTEALGLTALMLFHDARRATRVDDDGIPIALDEAADRRALPHPARPARAGPRRSPTPPPSAGPHATDCCRPASHTTRRCAQPVMQLGVGGEHARTGLRRSGRPARLVSPAHPR